MGQNPDMNISTDHFNMRRRKRHHAGKPAVRYGYEKVILSVVTQSGNVDDIPASYFDAINRVNATAWIEAMKFELKSLKNTRSWSRTLTKWTESH